MATQGAAILDFGASPTDRASVVVTGQASIVAASDVEAWLMAESNSENDVEAHVLANSLIRLTVGSIVAGTGFTIFGVCEAMAAGKFNVQWVWN